MTDFNHLLPQSAKKHIDPDEQASLEEGRLGSKEHTRVVEVLKAVGQSAGYISREAKNMGGKLDFGWLAYEGLFTFHFDFAEVKSYDIHTLFTTPTKLDVWDRFLELDKEHEKHYADYDGTLVLVFTTKNQSGKCFCMHNSQMFKARARVYMTFIVRDKPYYIQSWSEVLKAVREICRD